VIINVERVRTSQSDRMTQPLQSTRLQRLVDDGTIYVPQALSQQQFATLQALLFVLLPEVEVSPTNLAARLDAHLADATRQDWPYTSVTPDTDTYQLGLDGLDTLARTRAGFSFVELTHEIQDALLSLIATKDLGSEHLDLSLWLEDLRSNAFEIFVADATSSMTAQVTGNSLTHLGIGTDRVEP